MEEKVVLKLIAGTKKEFRMIKKRVEIGLSPKTKSGKLYQIQEDVASLRESYRMLVDSLPNQQAYLLISGVMKNGKSEFIECLYAGESIRAVFCQSKNESRLNLLRNYLKNKRYDYLEFQLAKAS